MQRRTGASNAASSTPLGVRGSSPISSALARRKGKQGNQGGFRAQPVLILAALAVLALTVSWIMFPEEVVLAETEAKHMGEKLAQKAYRAEQDVEHWLHQDATGRADLPPPATQNRAASDAATARMMAQSSKWVDGEKALKKKLMELADKQQKGELLGVPVLTRWLGEDFPAWVTPDMDQEKWRNDVAEKYKEMRQEEEKWIEDMKRIIDQRDGELGITSPK